MQGNELALIEEFEKGAITAEQAINKFEFPFTHLSEIKLEDLKVEVMGCGFPTLDKYKVFRKNRSQIIVVAGRPGHGKSALLFNLGLNIASEGVVLAYNLEMDQTALFTRLLSKESGISKDRIEAGDKPKQVVEAYNKLSERNFYLSRGSKTSKQIRSEVTKAAENMPVAAVVIDYLGIVVPVTDNGDNRHLDIGDILVDIKAAADAIRGPIIIACQLSRVIENKKRDNFVPSMSDLAESSKIEATADVILGVTLPHKFSDEFDPELAQLHIIKSREGTSGVTLDFKFDGRLAKFIDPMKGAY